MTKCNGNRSDFFCEDAGEAPRRAASGHPALHPGAAAAGVHFASHRARLPHAAAQLTRRRVVADALLCACAKPFFLARAGRHTHRALRSNRGASGYNRLLELFFDGVIPPPPPPLTFCDHYLDFPGSFLQHAVQTTGRTVLEIDGCIYDVSGYVDIHPGDRDLLLAAGGTDATATFHAVGHSTNARRLLGPMLLAPRSSLVPAEETALYKRRQQQRPSDASPLPENATWRAYGHAVLEGMRSESGRAALRNMLRMGFSALAHDLTEGRPDCRRLSPAVWRLVAGELLATRWTAQGKRPP